MVYIGEGHCLSWIISSVTCPVAQTESESEICHSSTGGIGMNTASLWAPDSSVVWVDPSHWLEIHFQFIRCWASDINKSPTFPDSSSLCRLLSSFRHYRVSYLTLRLSMLKEQVFVFSSVRSVTSTHSNNSKAACIWCLGGKCDVRNSRLLVSWRKTAHSVA